MNDREVEVRDLTYPTDEKLLDAIDLASDQDTVTWLTESGRRVAAIVPVDVAESDPVRRLLLDGGSGS